MAHWSNDIGGNVYFHPFCSNDFLDFTSKCLGCEHLLEAGIAVLSNQSRVLNRKGTQRMCNPLVTEFPLPLHKCSICNNNLLNAALLYLLVICILSILANGWSMLVWLKQTEKSPQIIFKLSLTASDFLFGVLVLPATTAQLINTFYLPHKEYYSFYFLTDRKVKPEDYQKNWEGLFMSKMNYFTALMLYISQGTSLFSVLLLNVDRHIAIAHGIKYNQIMTKARSLWLVLAVWLLVGLLGFASAFACGSYRVVPFAFFLPIVEATEDGELAKTLIIYLLPLGLVFFASFGVALHTTLKLYKLSKTYSSSKSSRTSSVFSRSFKRFTSGKTDFSSFKRHFKTTKIHHAGGSEKSEDESDGPTQGKASPKQTSLENVEITWCSENNDSRGGAVQSVSMNNDKTDDRKRKAAAEKKNSAKQSITSRCSSQFGRRNEYRYATRTLLLILGSYAVCVLPLTLSLVIYLVYKVHPPHDGPIDDMSIYTAFFISVAIFMTSSLRNCIIYSLRNRRYRATSKKLFRKIFSKAS